MWSRGMSLSRKPSQTNGFQSVSFNNITFTFFKKFVPQDRVHAHSGVDANNAATDPLILDITFVRIVEFAINSIEVCIDFLQPIPCCQI